MDVSRNPTVFYWKSTNLIGSPAVFNSLIENGCARVAVKAAYFLEF